MRGWVQKHVLLQGPLGGRVCACIVTHYFAHVSVLIQVLYVEHALPQGPVNTVHYTHTAGNVTTTDSCAHIYNICGSNTLSKL